MLVLLIALALAAEPTGPAPSPPAERACKPLAAGELMNVDFADTPLLDVARVVSCALEKNLLFQPSALGTKQVSVLAPKPIGRRDLLTLWHALLSDQGLVEERHGAFDVVRPLK